MSIEPSAERGPLGLFLASYSLKGKASLLIGLSVINVIAGSLTALTLILYLHEAGFGLDFYGLLASAGVISMTALLLPCGALADRFGGRSVLGAGLLLAVGANAVYILFPAAPGLIAGAVMNGASSAFYEPSFRALLSDESGGGDRKRVFSFQAFCGMMGSTLAFFLAGALPDALSGALGRPGAFRLIFAMSACLLLAQFILLRATGLQERRAVGGVVPETGATDWQLLLKFALPNALLGLGAGFVIPFFPVYFIRRFGVSTTVVGAIFAATQLVWAAAFLIMPRMADRVGTVRLYSGMQMVAIGALLLIPLAPALETVALLYAVRTIMMNAAGPVAMAFMMDVVPPGQRARAVSTHMLGWNVANAASPPLGGFMMEYISLVYPFYICGGFYAVSVGSYYGFFRKRREG